MAIDFTTRIQNSKKKASKTQQQSKILFLFELLQLVNNLYAISCCLLSNFSCDVCAVHTNPRFFF
jgi:hypothetical protein